ncbi:uncharacterized protein LOC135147211 [Daucus carota subsp. sativus]|uniref:uncharacterized protein LOC135147211 n=1 Tax=Daucus carota subsp. sativus TaxID=79200 RepID=UPI0030837890
MAHMNFPSLFVSWVRACVTTAMFSIKVNWASCGYFKGAKGIHQGDSMSPYLFTIGAMHVFSCILNDSPPLFKFHWRCKELRLTHLFFADDVLLFSHGDVDSISHLMSSLERFGNLSGLTASINKSTSFFCNCETETIEWFDLNYSMPRGLLPVKFLGVPLISSKLCINDCGAKVSWVNLCLPKEEGGLGLKKSEEWNYAQIILHLWSVVIQKGSLWSNWVINSVLRGRNFWVVPIPTDCSWIWRKVLKLRTLAKRFILYKLGNGISTSLWFDPWWKHNCLATYLTDPIIRAAGSTPNATVFTIICFGEWRLPRGNSQHHHSNHALATWLRDFDYPLFDLDQDDQISWEGVKPNHVTTRVIWDSIRIRGESCTWSAGVWCKLKITRFCFLSWLLCLDKVVTRSVLYDRHVISDNSCIFIVGGLETAHHLFINCPYARLVHRVYLSETHGITMDYSMDWKGWVLYFLAIADAPQRQILLLYLQVFSYHLWRERNARLHGGGSFGPRKLLTGIMVDMRGRAAASTWLSRLISSRPIICTWLI